MALPVTGEFLALHPGGIDDHAQFLDAMGSLAAELAVPWIDRHAAAGPELFADTHHLNGDGAARLSADLPAALDAAGVDARRCAPDR